MSVSVDLRVVELLSARLCHELISPVAAIGNGAELLAEDPTDFPGDAVAMIGASAAKAAARLQFYRFAYGFGRAGTVAGPPPHQLAAGFFADTRIICDYGNAARALPLEWQKLACNLLLVGAEALPRGGTVAVATDAAGGLVVDGNPIDSSGDGDGPLPSLESALALTAPVEELTTRTITAHFAGLLAAALNCHVAVTRPTPRRFRLAAVTEPAPVPR